MTQHHTRLSVALSGGGFRAALFHGGVLLRIAEAGWLRHLDVLSTVSGGSIFGAFLATRARQLAAEEWSAPGFRRYVLEPFTRAVSSSSFIGAWALRLPLTVVRKLRRPYTRTNLAADLYEQWFAYGSITALLERPYLIINATNLLSGRSWRFTRDGCGDSRFGYAAWTDAFPLAEAVAASAAFPPVFPPLALETDGRRFSGPVYGEAAIPQPRYMPLSDGGVYDNLGVEVLAKSTKVTARTILSPEFLLVSDGGYPPQARFRPSGMPALGEGLLLYRVDELARDQVGAQRRRTLVASFQRREPAGALVSLGSSIQKLPDGERNRYVDEVGADAVIPERVLQRIHTTRTQLNVFSSGEAEALTYHGYTLADAVLWAYRDAYPPAYRLTARGSWRVRFTATETARWIKALER
jgi:NTE family protein